MSAEIATLQRVRDAVETLRRSGVSPTADRVIELIGGGKSTVLAHLRTIRNVQPGATDMPQAILDIARTSLADIYRAGRSAEAETLRAATERLSTVIQDQDVQIDELGEQNITMAAANKNLSRQLDLVEGQRKELLDSFQRLQSEADALRGQVVAERSKVDEVKDTLARMERMLEKASVLTRHRDPSRRILSLSSTGDRPEGKG